MFVIISRNAKQEKTHNGKQRNCQFCSLFWLYCRWWVNIEMNLKLCWNHDIIRLVLWGRSTFIRYKWQKIGYIRHARKYVDQHRALTAIIHVKMLIKTLLIVDNTTKGSFLCLPTINSTIKNKRVSKICNFSGVKGHTGDSRNQPRVKLLKNALRPPNSVGRTPEQSATYYWGQRSCKGRLGSTRGQILV